MGLQDECPELVEGPQDVPQGLVWGLQGGREVVAETEGAY